MGAVIRGFIGVVHLGALPGDARYRGDGGFATVEAAALRDAEALVEGGVDGLMVENFGSAPFRKGTRREPAPPHQVAALALIARACAARFDVQVGVNCLRNDVFAALGVAAMAGARMVRVNVHTGAYVTDQGVIEGEAEASLRYRRALEAEDVALLADVLVKHAAPLAPITPQMATRDALERGLADGVIVTGDGTGLSVDRRLLEQVRAAAGERPVLIGSGLDPEQAPLLAPLADGAIVGTWLKVDGALAAPVDVERVRRMRGVLDACLRQEGSG